MDGRRERGKGKGEEGKDGEREGRREGEGEIKGRIEGRERGRGKREGGERGRGRELSSFLTVSSFPLFDLLRQDLQDSLFLFDGALVPHLPDPSSSRQGK